MICSIDYFYYDELKDIVVLGSRNRLYAKDGDTEDLLNMLCESNGRSLYGSIELFCKCNNAHQKPAVLVNPNVQEIYFPTHAKNNAECIWINYGKIIYFTSVGNRCMIEFAGGGSIVVNCSRKVIKNQMNRCEHLLKSLCNPYEVLNESVVSI